MRIFAALLATIFTAFLASAAPLQAFHDTHDPYVSNPSGAYSMLSNPASVIDTRALAVRAAVGFAGKGGMTSQLLAYLEPDMGLGAGALYWHTMSPDSGNRRQEFGYILARRASQHMYYGLTVKQLNEAGLRVWAADIGLLFNDLSRIRVGLTVHNFLGQSALNPLQVSGALSYEISSQVGFSLFASSPILTDTTGVDVGVAVDVELIPEAQIRLGRIRSLQRLEDYWQGSLTYALESVTFDAAILVKSADDLRFTIGVLYRF